MNIRLDKFLSSQNLGSRKEVKELIRNKNIFVNGNISIDAGLKLNTLIDEVKVNNKIIKYKEFTYIALNKPKDYVCARSDNKQKTVMELLGIYKNADLHIVGRLDKDTVGLVILTNNGDWTHKLKSPNSNTEKEYEVTLLKEIDDLMIEKITSDLYLDNKKLKPIIFLKTGANTCNVTLTEGKYHQIKRMFHLVNNEVIRLKRVRIHNIKLDELNIFEGEWKEIFI